MIDSIRELILSARYIRANTSKTNKLLDRISGDGQIIK